MKTIQVEYGQFGLESGNPWIPYLDMAASIFQAPQSWEELKLNVINRIEEMRKSNVDINCVQIYCPKYLNVLAFEDHEEIYNSSSYTKFILNAGNSDLKVRVAVPITAPALMNSADYYTLQQLQLQQQQQHQQQQQQLQQSMMMSMMMAPPPVVSHHQQHVYYASGPTKRSSHSTKPKTIYQSLKDKIEAIHEETGVELEIRDSDMVFRSMETEEIFNFNAADVDKGIYFYVPGTALKRIECMKIGFAQQKKGWKLKSTLPKMLEFTRRKMGKPDPMRSMIQQLPSPPPPPSLASSNGGVMMATVAQLNQQQQLQQQLQQQQLLMHHQQQQQQQLVHHHRSSQKRDRDFFDGDNAVEGLVMMPSLGYGISNIGVPSEL